ncbi:FHA domain-containing protein, partial [Myxococcota bacterium]|nr:FHA domain-containing protein [Myxococcota bacterium]
MFRLTITDKNGKAVVRQMEKDDITIGRRADNDIVLQKHSVSKKHARITKVGTTFRVVDNGSTNGTTINGERINGPYTLQPGDKIYIGNFIFEIDVNDASSGSHLTPLPAPGAFPAPAVMPTMHPGPSGPPPGASNDASALEAVFGSGFGSATESPSSIAHMDALPTQAQPGVNDDIFPAGTSPTPVPRMGVSDSFEDDWEEVDNADDDWSAEASFKNPDAPKAAAS